jgi:hypothetical protein
MAAGLFHRHGRTERPTDELETARTEECAAAEERAAAEDRQAAADEPTRAQRVVATHRAATEERNAADDRAAAGLGGRSLGEMRHPLATDQPLPPGGAVAEPETREQDRVMAERGSALAERDAAVTDRTAAEPAPRWARTSFAATLSLIIGLSSVYAALSGRLAPLAVLVGVVGLLVAGFALAKVSRKHVTGHHVALFGLLFSIAGVVFGILAINKSLPWLNGGADQAGQFRDWLNSHWSWLKRW